MALDGGVRSTGMSTVYGNAVTLGSTEFSDGTLQYSFKLLRTYYVACNRTYRERNLLEYHENIEFPSKKDNRVVIYNNTIFRPNRQVWSGKRFLASTSLASLLSIGPDTVPDWWYTAAVCI